MAYQEGRDDVVLLTIPALSGYFSVLPTAAAAVATRLGYSLEEIEDLRAAVNTAAHLLFSDARGESDLDCRMEVSDDQLCITINGAVTPIEGGYEWNMLSALADAVETGPRQVRIRQSLPRTEAEADTQRHHI
ncbi:ATP-binding protein [Salininema proteolyticum]|uniref:Anti-sigma regulatory factor n=1 Tax=Salininema proteolyticum TaxID=1607685 RepID=A0ABV8TYI7_9ACTN